MKIQIRNFSITIEWKAIAVVIGAIVVDGLSKREQLKSLNIDMGNQRISLNQ